MWSVEKNSNISDFFELNLFISFIWLCLGSWQQPPHSDMTLLENETLSLFTTLQLQPGVSIFVEHWGDNLQFYPNFALFST